MLATPLVPGLLFQRIDMFAQTRKPFIVTFDYVGPERRIDLRAGEAEPQPPFVVPNPVRARAMNEHRKLQESIDRAIKRINEHKMERHSVMLSLLSQRIVTYYRTVNMDAWDADEGTLIADLDRLIYASSDLARRIRGSAFAFIADLAATMNGVGKRLHLNYRRPSRVDIELLPRLALAIHRAFRPAEGNERIALEISASVALHSGGRPIAVDRAESIISAQMSRN